LNLVRVIEEPLHLPRKVVAVANPEPVSHITYGFQVLRHIADQ